jgi:hypothetical protein
MVAYIGPIHLTALGVTDLGPNTLVTIDVNGSGTIMGSMTLLGVNGVGANAVSIDDFRLAS